MKSRQSVLVVDDVKPNITILAELLKDSWDVKVALDGQNALRVASKVPQPDLILLDVMMPEMDGYEVCKQLKQMPETKDIPVIFVTAMDDETDEEYGFEVGAVDYITKPFTPALVKARVKNHLQLKAYSDTLKEQSMIDGLTGIANRRRFEETVKAEWSRGARSAAPLSLIMIDIDNFKAYNDSYGHLAGDDCLIRVAVAISEHLHRPADLLARWGGEEFVCLLPETDVDAAKIIGENLCKNVEDLEILHEHSSVSSVVTISLGLASAVPDSSKSFEDLLSLADKALYVSKESGRNKLSVSSDIL